MTTSATPSESNNAYNYKKPQNSEQHQPSDQDITTPLLYRKMKFPSKHQQKTTTLPITANFKLENYICNTKFKIDEHLQEIFTTHEVNLPRSQEKALSIMKKASPSSQQTKT